MFRILKNKELFSENILRDLISGYPLPTWIVSAKKHQIVFANNAVANQFGYSSGNSPVNFDEIFPENQRMAVVRDLSEKKFNGAYELLKKDGKKIEVLIHSSSITIDGELYFQVTAFEKPDYPDVKLQNAAQQHSSGEKEDSIQEKKEEKLNLSQLVEQTSDVKRSEQFYRALITNSLDGMLLMDADGKVTFASPSIKHVLGYEPEEVLNRNGFEFVHPDDIRWAFESFQKEVIEQPDVKYIVVRLLKKTGDWQWCMVRGHNLLGNKYVNSLVIYFHDDTMRKQATDALKESEKQFRNLIRDIQLGVVLQNKEGQNILCNDAFAQMFASSKEEILGVEIQDLAIDPIHEDGRRFSDEERPTYKAIQTKQPERDVVMGIIRPNVNHRVWLLINADPVLDEHGELLHIICCVKDITERKKMEEDQMIKQMQHQRQLTQASIDGQEKERKEIGIELHDNIGQQLTTIKLFLDIAKTTADDTTNEMVNMGLKGISDVINDIRAMSRSLVPSTLKDLGLVESIVELVDSFARTQTIRICFNHEGFNEDHLQENQKLALFRIIQEQLNNIVKHAKADNANIRLGNHDQLVILEVSDDGTGFEIDKIKKGLGFINIKNRAELLDGLSEIISSPGKGCVLKVVLPVVPIS